MERNYIRRQSLEDIGHSQQISLSRWLRDSKRISHSKIRDKQGGCNKTKMGHINTSVAHNSSVLLRWLRLSVLKPISHSKIFYKQDKIKESKETQVTEIHQSSQSQRTSLSQRNSRLKRLTNHATLEAHHRAQEANWLSYNVRGIPNDSQIMPQTHISRETQQQKDVFTQRSGHTELTNPATHTPVESPSTADTRTTAISLETGTFFVPIGRTCRCGSTLGTGSSTSSFISFLFEGSCCM